MENVGTGKEAERAEQKNIKEPKQLTSYIETKRKLKHSYFNY